MKKAPVTCVHRGFLLVIKEPDYYQESLINLFSQGAKLADA